MKLQLFMLSALKYLVLTNQQEGENKLLTTTVELDIESYLEFIYNSSPPDLDESSAPCKVTAPGLPGSSLALMITYIVVFVFSLVGNSVVVYVVCNMKKRRASTDIYLMHLAIADLLFSLTLPFWAVDVHSGWNFGGFLCKLLSGFQEASVYSGVFLLACISVDRHFAIVRATRALFSRHLLVKVACSVVWLAAGLLSLPVIIQKDSMHAKDLGRTICYENLTGESIHHWRVGLRVLRHTLGFFLPLLVMAVCYGWTLVALFHTRNQQKHKAMRVILAVVLAFVLCWLPYNVAVLIDTYDIVRSVSFELDTCITRYRVKVMLNVTQVLAFTHCAVNPVLYAFIGQKFRNQLLAALYQHGVISKRFQMAYKTASVSSVGSTRSRHTSTTMQLTPDG